MVRDCSPSSTRLLDPGVSSATEHHSHSTVTAANMTLRLTLEELRTLFKCILLDNTHKDIFNAQFELFQFAQTGELVLRYKGSCKSSPFRQSEILLIYLFLAIVLLQKFGPSSSACLLSSYDLQHVLGFCPLPDSSTSAFFTNMCTGFHPQLREWVLMYKGQGKCKNTFFDVGTGAH